MKKIIILLSTTFLFFVFLFSTNVFAADTTKPTVPTGLTGTAVSATEIDLSWNASTDNVGVTGYKIYRNGTYLITIPANGYSNVGLTSNLIYSYQVSAIDAANNESALSLSIDVATFDPTSITPIIYGQTISGSLSNGRLIKTYSFAGQVGDLVDIAFTVLTTGQSNFPMRVQILDSNAVLLTDVFSISSKDVNYTLPASGVYTIRVSSNNLGGIGTFELSLQRSNDPANVTAINWGDTNTGNITVTNFNVYRFTGNVGDQVDLPVVITSTGQGGLNLRVRIMDSAAVTLVDQMFTNSKDITYTLSATGAYTIWFSSSGGRGNYQFTLQRLNDPGNITVINWGDTKTGSISLTNFNIYRFSGKAGDSIDLPIAIVSTGQGGFNLRVRIKDAAAVTLLDTSFTSSKDIHFTLPADGDYTIWVNAVGGGSFGTYKITLQWFNDPANVMPVKWGDTKSSSISEPTRIDVYGFSGQQGDQLVMPVAIGSTGQGGFNMRVRLFDSNSLLKLDVTTTSAKEIQYVLPMTGTYKLWINAQDNVTTGDYAFTLQRYNSPGNVIPVTFGETKSGDILPPTKIAVYLINANTGDDLIIPLKTTASGQGGTYQTRLRLFDDKNTLILDQATDGTGAVKEIRYSVASGGVFYAWVTAMSIGQTGSYQFTLSDNLLSNVTAAPIFLDPTNNGQVSIGYDLQRDANVKIDLYKATLDFDDLVESTFPGVFHKAFYQNIFTGTCPKGHCTFVWNGKDAQGNSFSENAYVYTITADDMTGARHGSFDPEYVRGGVTILNNHLTLPNADPYKGEMTSVSYDLAAPSWVTLRIVRLSMSLEGSMRDLLISAPRDMANNSEMWDGHDNKGNVVPADKYTMYGAATLLPSNAIVVQKKNIVAVPYLQIDPYAFYPEYGELTNIKYTISKDAAVTLEVKNSAGTTVRLLLNAISQTAGTYSFLWDGRDGAGHPIGNAGNYHIVLTAVDNSGAIVTRNINALLFK